MSDQQHTQGQTPRLRGNPRDFTERMREILSRQQNIPDQAPNQAPRWFGSMEEFMARALPRYGKFGGPMWSGGQWLGSLKENPIDELDGAFKVHDNAYGEAKNPADYIAADKALISYLETYLANKKYLSDKNADTFAKKLKAHNYAILALQAFKIKNGVMEQPLHHYRSGMDTLGRSKLKQAIRPGVAPPFLKINHTAGAPSAPDALTPSTTPTGQQNSEPKLIEASASPLPIARRSVQPQTSLLPQMATIQAPAPVQRSLDSNGRNWEKEPISNSPLPALDNVDTAASPWAATRPGADQEIAAAKAMETGVFTADAGENGMPAHNVAFRDKVLEALKHGNDGQARTARSQAIRHIPDALLAVNAYGSKADRVARALLGFSA